jgi:hypothetical protein
VGVIPTGTLSKHRTSSISPSASVARRAICWPSRSGPGGSSGSEDAKAAGAWSTTAGGEYYAVGVNGTVTGRRAHGAIIDDPVKGREDADSESLRQTLWDWYLSDLRTRLLPDAWIILIQTRWHEEDLAAGCCPRITLVNPVPSNAAMARSGRS